MCQCKAPEPFEENPLDPLSPNYVPSPPVGLYGYAASTSEIMIVWTDRSLGETGFQIERRWASSSFSEIKRVAADEHTYLDNASELVRGRTYIYRVRAYTAKVSSEYSGEVSIRLP